MDQPDRATGPHVTEGHPLAGGFEALADSGPLPEVRWAKRRGLTHYDMVGVPKPEDLDESSSLWGVYKFKEGFGGELVDTIGCFDLSVRRTHAAAWYKFEPVYYRLYYKLKNNVFY